MRKLRFPATAVIALALAVPALAAAGHSTYHKVKSGSLAVKVSAAGELDSTYGIVVGSDVGSLKLKRGGSVYESSNSMSSDVKGSFTIKYDTRGADGNKGGVTTLKFTRLAVTVGKKNSFLIGNVSGSSTVPGVTVLPDDIRIFNFGGGKMKKKKGKFKYVFNSNDVTFNSAVTTMLNKFGTPKGKDMASAKVDLGSVSVKVK